MSPASHLNEEELVDLLEGVLPEGRAGHLSACDACRSHAEALGAVLGQVARVDIPEPSPLFWNHLAARVHDSIVDVAPGRTGWRGWIWSPATGWAAGTVSLALTLALVHPAGVFPPGARMIPPAAASVSTTSGTVLSEPDDVAKVDDVDADEAWALVRGAADDVAWDGVHDAGISARPGAADRMVLELTRTERTELARLLEDELRKTGA